MKENRRLYIQDKEYECICGCSKLIEVKPFHKYQGVPRFIQGHTAEDRPTYIRTTKHNKLMSDIKKKDNAWKGCKHSDEQRKKWSIDRSGENHYLYGKHLPKETCRKISKKKKGQPSHMKDKKHTPEALEKMSIIKLGNKNSLGHIHSSETRTKQSIKAIDRIINNDNINPSWQHCKKGYHYSEKNDQDTYYSSSYEKKAYELLDKIDEVKSYERCKFAIPYDFDGYTKNYIPDILVTYIGKLKKVIEIKPKSQIKYDKNIAKFKSAKEYCTKNNLTFSIWTENKLFI